MIDFSTLKTLTIPEGDVKRIEINGETKWELDVRNLYQRVEYIASVDKKQYIVTDYTANNTTGLELTLMAHDNSDTICGGSRISGSNARFYTPYLYASSRQYYGWNTARTLSLSVKTNTKHTSRLNWLNSRKAEMLDVNESVIGSASFGSTSLATQKAPICFFCGSNGDGTYSGKRNMKLYGARISQGADVVREYIPCYRKSDGATGVFEVFTNTFFIHSGTGEFECGAEMEWQ